jgi:plastocyanin
MRMRTMIARLVAVAAMAAVLPWIVGLGFAEGRPPATPGASPEASPSASPAASPAADAVAVSIFDFGFDAAEVKVPVGTTVTWTNDGEVIHTTTSKDGIWDSAILNPGDTFSYTFDEAGTYEYWCTLHPQMLATIVVTEP